MDSPAQGADGTGTSTLSGDPSSPDPASDNDPVLRQRERMAQLARTGQRLGYLLFALAMAGFALGLALGFEGFVTTAIVGCLVLGSVVLAPTIILGYAVKAADREDRGLPHGH